eukprot:13276260-Alexandrium_andersonii.AAC.1
MQSHTPLVKKRLGPQLQPDGVAIPARQTGQVALFAARNRLKSETHTVTTRCRRPRARTCGT